MSDDIHVLTSSQIESIKKDMIKIFGENIETSIQLNFNELKLLVQKILTRIKLSEIITESGNKYHVLLNLSKRRQKLLAEGYLIIMYTREYLTNTPIDYRYYYTNTQGNTTLYHFQDKDLPKYIGFNTKSIYITPSKLKGINQTELDKAFQNYVNEYFNLFTNPDVNSYMRSVTGSGYIVRSAIMNQYFGSNPGLKSKKPNKHNQYQVFNKGHIREAVDNAISDILSNDEILNNSNLQQQKDKIVASVFGNYLYYDTVKASQGPDNPNTNTSIKANGSDLYDYFTIINQLEKINNMLMYPNKQNIINVVSDVFLHKSNFGDSVNKMKEEADKIAEKVLEDLNKLNKI